jgi:glycosyltransferase involved in cell wall biosynthesis
MARVTDAPKRTRRRALLLVHSYYLRDTRPRRHAVALSEAGWEVDVVCARAAGERARERIDGITIQRLPARRRRASKPRYLFEYISFTLMAFLSVTRRHLFRRYDTVYVVGIPNFLVFAALVPRLLGARVLLDMRDPLPEFFQAKYELGGGHPLVRALRLEEKLSARFASGVVTVDPSMASLYVRSVPPARISVVMNAPDPRLFTVPQISTRDPSDRTLLYTGKSVAYRYGVDLAVRAVARLRGEIPGLRLRVVGDGDLIPTLRALAQELDVTDAVSLERSVPVDQIPAIVDRAWVGVQPNREDPLMRFSLSQKVLEWCLLGLPVVCGETLPLREVFPQDEVLFHRAGDLNGLCSRLLEAHGNPVALRERAGRARDAVERISYKDQIAKLLEVFETRA